MKSNNVERGLFLALALGCTAACDLVLDASSYKVKETVDGGSTPTDTDAGDAGPECHVNADCASRGEYFICRKADSKCVALQSPDCTRVVGDYKNDNAVIFGSLLPTEGPDKSSGLPVQNAIELAIADFNTVGGITALPNSSAKRPLVLVGCNDSSTDENAFRAAEHLANELRVPAIIGAAFSGVTIRVANKVTIPAKTLLISPSATSIAITSLQDDGLVWRTSPSDLLQADAHLKLFPSIDARVRQQTIGQLPAKIKVAIAHKGDAYGTNLAKAVQDGLSINDKPALDQAGNEFNIYNYGDPDDPAANPTKYPETISSIATMAPHVIYLFGITETVTEMIKGIEGNWNAAYRPIYLLADGGLVTELVPLVSDPAAGPTKLRERILGTIYGSNRANFKTFKTYYLSKFNDGTSPDTGGCANGYDALYNLAFAASTLGDRPLNGMNLKDGFSKLVSGTLVSPGSATITAALQTLSSGGSINYDGASGPLDYDVATGEARSDIQVWCVPLDGQGKPATGRASSVFYDATTNALVGSIGNTEFETTCKFN